MQTLLYAPQRPSNVGMIVRSAGGLDVNTVYIVDERGVVSQRREKVRKVAEGALDRVKLVTLRESELEGFIRGYKGRKVATVCNPQGSVLLYDFECHDDDLVLIGNEADGLPTYLLSMCDTQVHIPLFNGLNSLNIACAFTAVAYEYLRQNQKS